MLADPLISADSRALFGLLCSRPNDENPDGIAVFGEMAMKVRSR